MIDDELPEWSKAKISDYAALNATPEPWPAAKMRMETEFGYPGGYVAWGPFVVEGLPAFNGKPIIQAMLMVGNAISGGAPAIAFGDDRPHFILVKGRVLPLEDGSGVTLTSTDDDKITLRAIKAGDGPIVGLPPTATVKDMLATLLGGVEDDE